MLRVRKIFMGKLDESFKKERDKAIDQLKSDDIDSYFLGILENNEDEEFQFCYNYEYNTEDTDGILKRDKYLLASILRVYKEKYDEEKDIEEIAEMGVKAARNLYLDINNF